MAFQMYSENMINNFVCLDNVWMTGALIYEFTLALTKREALGTWIKCKGLE